MGVVIGASGGHPHYGAARSPLEDSEYELIAELQDEKNQAAEEVSPPIITHELVKYNLAAFNRTTIRPYADRNYKGECFFHR